MDVSVFLKSKECYKIQGSSLLCLGCKIVFCPMHCLSALLHIHTYEKSIHISLSPTDFFSVLLGREYHLDFHEILSSSFIVFTPSRVSLR